MTRHRQRSANEERDMLESADFAPSSPEAPPSTEPAAASKLAQEIERQRREIDEPGPNADPSARRLSSAGVTVVLSESFGVASVPPTVPTGDDGGPGGTLPLDPAATEVLGGRVEVTVPLPGFVPTREHQRRSSDFPVAETPTLKTSFAPEHESRFVDEQPGRYTYLRRLGAGGIGEVNVVRDESLGRDVAFKELHASLTVGSADPAATPGSTGRTPAELRFVNEARITGQLEHPGIVPVYELGRRRDARLYYTMRLVRGRTLSEALAGRSLRERMDLLPHFVDVCNAVAYAHDHGIVHRDLKPDNIMLGDFGETVVLDWGLAKARGERDVQARALADEFERLQASDGLHTVAGVPLGTPSYMPPEQARGDLGQIDERSDVYALGAILYQLLTGAPPFAEGTAWEVIKALQEQEVRPPPELEPGCSEELAAVALRALEKRPERRYANAQGLAADVNAFLTGGLVVAHRYRWGALLWRWVRRHAVAISVVVGLMVVASAAWWYRGVIHRQQLARLEAQRQADLHAEVDRLLADVAGGKVGENWLALYSYRLISLKEPAVEAQLIPALAHDNVDVRMLAARALGGMKSAVAVGPLVARLEEGVEPSPEAKIEVISALAIIGDPSADRPVAEARSRAGQHSALWKRTELAYSMIPMPPLDENGGALSPEQWKERAASFYEKGRERAAIAALNRAIELDPKFAPAYNNRANAHLALSEYDRALSDLDRAIELEPDQLSTVNNRALLRKRLEDYEGALRDFDRLVAAGELGATPVRNRARVRLALRDFAGAIEDFETARALEPGNPMNFSGIGEVWLAQNDLPRAVEALSRALELNEKYPRALVRRATAHHALGDLVAARSDLERALVLEPKHPWAAGHLAILELSEGDFEEAQRILDRSVALDPKEAAPYANRAIVLHLARGSASAALEDLDRALELETGEIARVEYRLYRAQAMLARGRRDAAEKVVATLPERTGRRWDAYLIEVSSGRRSLEQAEALAYSPDRRCSLYLAAGLAEELDHKPDVALARYQEAGKLDRPADLSCRSALLAVRRLEGLREGTK